MTSYKKGFDTVVDIFGHKYIPYRFAFNGKEKDDEGMGGGGSTYDYGFRIYNEQIGRFLSVDPLAKKYPWYTPYQFAGNTPIQAIDLDGLEEWKTNTGYRTPDGDGPLKPQAGPLSLSVAYEMGYRSYEFEGGQTVLPSTGKLSSFGESILKKEEGYKNKLYDNDGAHKTLNYHYLEGKTIKAGTVISGNTTIAWGHLVHYGPIIPDAAIDENLAAEKQAESPFKNGVTSTTAQNLLNTDVGEVTGSLNKSVKTSLCQNQYDALVSFGFNAGIGNLKPIVSLINAGDLLGASNSIRDYTSNNSRRIREAKMFNKQNIFKLEKLENGNVIAH